MADLGKSLWSTLGRRSWLALALALLATVALAAAACGGAKKAVETPPTEAAATEAAPANTPATGAEANGDKKAVEAAVRATVDAWNNKDLDTFLAGWTDAQLQKQFGGTRDQLKQVLPQFIGTPPITLGKFANTNVSGGTATTEVGFALGILEVPQRFTLHKEGNVWQIDSTENVSPEIPSGVTVVDLKTQEFQFVFDAKAITSGNIAFRVENAGGQPHDITLFTIPEGLDLQTLLQAQEPPPGVEEIGSAGPFAPGEKTNVLFTQPLKSGRYLMLCLQTDPSSGKSHVELGMFAEFTVP